MDTCLLWFRRDLRLLDNPALNWAIQNSKQIIALYIDDSEEDNPWRAGAASRWWLHHSLQHLQQQLKAQGIELQLLQGDSISTLEQVLEQTHATQLVFNHLYEPYYRQQAAQLQQQLQTRFADRVTLQGFDSGLFFKPGSVLNNQQQPYRVYTPFYKKLRPLLDQHYSHYRVSRPQFTGDKSPALNQALPLEKLALLDTHPTPHPSPHSWHEKFNPVWSPGEAGAHQALEAFLEQPIMHYQQQRDIPAINGTSRLSASLHFGEITPQQIFLSLQPLLHGQGSDIDKNSIESFIKQLLWREFAHHVLWHFPHTQSQPMDNRYHNSFWKNDDALLQQWQQGRTGIAIIDAGMQQLWQTGWMHNRVRMICSSFLTKNLGLHWLQGARWFWDTLVDANLANNTMGWQWVAGCGVDAAPYYRIFNPLTQSKRFDPNNRYTQQWLDTESYTADATPLVDLSSSREAALLRFKQHIKQDG
ncbi:MAG TPA: deoxyribodipyrimidine photo-lyase [Gammaproteobacteria bacterium]